MDHTVGKQIDAQWRMTHRVTHLVECIFRIYIYVFLIAKAFSFHENEEN